MLYYDLAVFGYQVTCLITMSAVYVCTELEIYYCHKDPSYRKAEECYIIPLDQPTHTHSQEWIVTQQPLVRYYPNFKLRMRRPKQSFRILHMKTTSHGRRPQNNISGISQQPLFGSYSNFKLNLR